MIQLSTLLVIMSLMFGYVGFTRGWNKEIIATSGIVLALFALYQFDDLLTNLFINIRSDHAFFIRTIFLGIVAFFAYQTRALIAEDKPRSRGGADGRDSLQSSVLGALVGCFNGYLVWGSLWYFMDVTGYPLQPYISAPIPGTASANFVGSLPLYLDPSGNLLAAAMIALFLVVLIVI